MTNLFPKLLLVVVLGIISHYVRPLLPLDGNSWSNILADFLYLLAIVFSASWGANIIDRKVGRREK